MPSKITLISLLALLSGSIGAQSFTDDFEAYTAGDYVAQKNTKWTTWKNQPGTPEDVQVVNTKAHSGTNSLLLSSALSGGGPQDLVLPFGATHNTGLFVLEWWMWVHKDSTAYMNLQGNGTYGQQYALDLYWLADGWLECRSNGDLRMKASVAQGQWVKVTLNANLSSNTWEVLLDGVKAGSFESNINQVNALDIFPIKGSLFYVDDIQYNHTPMATTALNMAATSIKGMTGYLAGQQGTPSVIVRNLGTTAITSYKIELDYNGNKTSQTASGVNIASLGYDTLRFTSPITLVAGSNNLTATLVQVNSSPGDDVSADNSKSMVLNPVVPAAHKAVVAEEGTGTWCGWCPRGAVFMDMLHDKYGDLFVPIAVHNGASDPMRNRHYDSLLGTKISGYPSAIVDRGADIDPSGMEADFLNRIVLPPAAAMTPGAQYDAGSSMLRVSLTTKFLKAVTGNYRIAIVLTEDSVHSTDPSYKQSNYYAGGGSGEMGGFEKLPNPVPAAKMWYSHVARHISPSFGGQPSSFPASVNLNDQFTHTVSYWIDPKWKPGQFHLVGLLIAPDGRIDNAVQATLAEAEANGLKSGTEIGVGIAQTLPSESGASLYPNPATSQATLSFELSQSGPVSLHIVAADGRQVAGRNYGNMQAGAYQLPVNCGSFASGIYLCHLVSGNSSTVLRLVKE